jgi:hypothetical protein
MTSIIFVQDCATGGSGACPAEGALHPEDLQGGELPRGPLLGEALLGRALRDRAGNLNGGAPPPAPP